MKAIRYSIFTLLVFIVIVFLGAPPLVGLWVKGQYAIIIRSFNRMNPNITAVISQYRFGWFHSEITTTFDIHLTTPPTSKKPSADRHYRVQTFSNIAQGPAIFLQKGHDKKMTVALAAVTLNIPSLHLVGHSLWRLKKSIDWQFASPGFQTQMDAAKITLKSLQGTATLDLRSRRLQVHAGIAAARLSMGQRLIGFHRLQYVADIQKMGMINYGLQSLSIDRLALRLDPKHPIKVNGFSVTTNSTVRDGKVSVFNHFRLKKISKNVLGLHRLGLDFAISDIDQDRLNHLFEILSLQHDQNAFDVQAVSQASMALWQAGFDLQLHYLLLNTQRGPLLLKGMLSMPRQSNATQLFQMLAALQADVTLRVPQRWLVRRVTAFVKKANQPTPKPTVNRPGVMAKRKIQGWVKQQWLVRAGKHYEARIQHQAGVLLVNGRPFQLTTLLQKQAPS